MRFAHPLRQYKVLDPWDLKRIIRWVLIKFLYHLINPWCYKVCPLWTISKGLKPWLFTPGTQWREVDVRRYILFADIKQRVFNDLMSVKAEQGAPRSFLSVILAWRVTVINSQNETLWQDRWDCARPVPDPQVDLGPVSLGDIPAGIYLIKISDDRYETNMKFVKR